MIPLDGPAVGSLSAAAVPATLLPLVFDPDTGRLFWLDTDRRLVASPVSADGRTSLAFAAPVPRAGDDERTDVVATLLHDIAEFTGRPLPVPDPAPPVDGRDEYIVVWVDNCAFTRTPRQAAEQAWRTIRRPGSHACVFQVVNRHTGARVEVDLLDDEDGTNVPDGGSPS
ncbi:hypothetical protein [Virgisporangium aurantiacum]|uniref:Uncharacterized protein n=1 Tax=Virgisporangium aurantiacum TaxID=175570 RepID=A0A8J3ZHN4_9ACTN|nr:hypothetical protein [Virgisporangium aurantiacum]GIJ62070.1 hypothetical protein Vau01_095860 [Virgisporangium aurantiacum]